VAGNDGSGDVGSGCVDEGYKGPVWAAGVEDVVSGVGTWDGGIEVGHCEM